MWNPQAAAPLAAIQAALRDAAILGAVIRAEVIPGAATRAEAVREVIPQADNKAPDRTLKTTQKCSR